MKRAYLTIAIAATLGGLLVSRAAALATETFGNEPLSELNYRQWRGIMPLINDKARVFATWANGNEHLYYRGNTTDLNAALAAFAKVEAKHHIVVLLPGPAAGRAFDGKGIPYNWKLHVLGGLAGAHAKDDPADLESLRDPVLTVFVGGDIDLDKVAVPEGIAFRAPPRPKQEAPEADGSARDTDAVKKIADFLQAHSPTTRPAVK